ISNTTALPFSGNWREIMAKQLTVPTHFGSCIQYLVEHEQIDQTLEIGPGKVLSSFARQVDRHLKCSHIGNYAEYQTFVEEEHGIKG
ncbi:MAG: ACP S-malonyltransferase, partial [Lactobacillus crispatus]|nr:ACP S-malonyltransferase [Lactobacillus crispatus]